MPTENVTILVVDDEPAALQQIVKALAQQGYHVLEASHAIHALQLCKRHPGPIHLLITDVVMPYMNGRELASFAPAMRPQMRVLNISGYEDRLTTERPDLKEDVPFLQKPFSPDTLLQKIRDILGSSGPSLQAAEGTIAFT
ncbi:MAG: response regulator [Nitrospirota bacterium]|nr:response regulator [Nitrospirota bacterium]